MNTFLCLSLGTLNSQEACSSRWQTSTGLETSVNSSNLRKTATANNSSWSRAQATTSAPNWQTSRLRLRQQGSLTFKVATGSTLALGLNAHASTDALADLDFSISITSTTTRGVTTTRATATQAGTALHSPVAIEPTTLLGIERLNDGRIEFYQTPAGQARSLLASATTTAHGPLDIEALLQTRNSEILQCEVTHDDSDFDSLPDGWEQEHFGNLDHNAQGDADADNSSNLDEFKDGTDPAEPHDYARSIRWSTPVNASTGANESSLTRASSNAAGQPLAAAYNASADACLMDDAGNLRPCLLQGDGSVTFEPDAAENPQTAASQVGPIMTLGLAYPNTTTNNTDITWAFILAANGTLSLKVPESAAAITLTGMAAKYHQGSQLRLTRRNHLIHFYHDSTLLHSSSTLVSGPLQVDCSLNSVTSNTTRLAKINRASFDDGDKDQDGLPDHWERAFLPPDHGWNDLLAFTAQGDPDNDGVSNADEYLDGTNPASALSFAQPVLWHPLTNCGTQTANNQSPGNGYLRKTTGPAGFNADALAARQDLEPLILQEDGLLTFQAATGSTLVIGLTESNNNSNNSDCEWAFSLTATNTFSIIRKHDSATALAISSPINRYDANTCLSIQRQNGIITFLKNQIVIHRATTPSSGPLLVDCSLSSNAAAITRARIYNGDTDQDDLPDRWELTHFGGLQAQDQLGDPDSDGSDNLDEYIEGSNPTLAPLRNQNLLWSSINPAANASTENNGNAITKGSAAATGWNTDATANFNNAQGNPQLLELGLFGSLSFTASDIGQLSVGLTPIDNNRSYTDYEYSIVINAATASAPGSASIYEGGTTSSTLRTSIDSFYPSSRFTIRRIGRQIEYLKNNLLFYRSTLAATSSTYRIEVALNTSDNARTPEVKEGAKLTSARLSSGDVDQDNLPDDWELQQILRRNPNSTLSYSLLDEHLGTTDHDNDGFTTLQEYQHQTDPLNPLSYPRTLAWTSLTNTSTSTAANTTPGNGYLRKSAGTAAYNADATSNRSLQGDLTLSFSAPPGTLAVGLTSSDDNAAQTDLEYAFILSASAISLRCPENSNLSITGSYDANSLFTITRRSGKLSFFKDGLLLHESNTTNSNALFADCSLSTLNQTLSSSHFTGDDEDQDGISDRWEWRWLGHLCSQQQWTDFGSTDHDQDGDGLSDQLESQLQSNPTSSDSDRDGMPDAWEQEHGLALLDPDNADSDLDSDQLDNLNEYRAGTNPRNPDCDGDQMPDGFEAAHSLDPLNDLDSMGDADGDQIPNLTEHQRGTAPSNPESRPRFDAIIIPDLPFNNRLTLPPQYGSLFEAIDQLKSIRPRPYPLLIKLSPGYHRVSISDPDQALVLIGSQTYDNQFASTPVIIESAIHRIDADFHANGIVFSQGHLIIGNQTDRPDRKVSFGNCIFRNIEPSIDETLGIGAPAAITHLQGQLTLIQCTLQDCASQDDYTPLHRNHQNGYSIANLSAGPPRSPNLRLVRCLLWTQILPPDQPIFGQHLNLQSQLQGPDHPQLSPLALPQAQSPLTIQTPLPDPSQSLLAQLQPRDIFNQFRNGPSLGAVAWLDSDQDQLPDWWELNWYPSLNHIEAQTITDEFAVEFLPPLETPNRKTALRHYLSGSNPRSNDSDLDLLPDPWERIFFSKALTEAELQDPEASLDPLRFNATDDPDQDGHSNLVEFQASSDPSSPDDQQSLDGDQLPDTWERTYFSDFNPPLIAPNPLRFGDLDDPDQDGITNLLEWRFNTNPALHNQAHDANHDGLADTEPDSDRDGLFDSWEQAHFAQAVTAAELQQPLASLNPLRFSANDDPDQDNLSNLTEFQQGSDPTLNPNQFDTDQDRLPDQWERDYFSKAVEGLDQVLPGNPINPLRFHANDDPDRDNANNLLEWRHGTDPTWNDSNPYNTRDSSSTLSESWMLQYFGNLNVSPLADDDGDGLDNHTEMQRGSNPLMHDGNISRSPETMSFWEPTNNQTGSNHTFEARLEDKQTCLTEASGEYTRADILEPAPWSMRKIRHYILFGGTQQTSGFEIANFDISISRGFDYEEFLPPDSCYCNPCYLGGHDHNGGWSWGGVGTL